jgi:hypothetical protein
MESGPTGEYTIGECTTSIGGGGGPGGCTRERDIIIIRDRNENRDGTHRCIVSTSIRVLHIRRRCIVRRDCGRVLAPRHRCSVRSCNGRRGVPVPVLNPVWEAVRVHGKGQDRAWFWDTGNGDAAALYAAAE